MGRLGDWVAGVFRRPARLLHIASDVGHGPPVILVHGIASSSVTFAELVPLLQASHRCISIDILGFGRSPVPPNAEYTLEEHVEWLQRTISSLKLKEPFVLVGHSLGALITARYTALHQGRVDKLVLVGPPIYISPEAIGNQAVRARVAAYLRAYEFIRANKDFTIRNATVLARLLRIGDRFEITEANWVPFVSSLEKCIESQTVVSDIAGIHRPIEIVYGALDAFVAPGGLDVVERMSHVRVHRVEVNDHLIRRRLAREIARVIN
ncbi:alpha/beta fold hydrolase [Homoserinimonas sp. OAct 916]|uniref:alpha/beta fold hydrolase n=1 Tax=Homoserinimonas sp. OAct 916 TaxID=2211450 RepID=UPI000DBEA04A|nr:alpha/beta hydrolase [Homoserinimonas sp. OAct 916]